MSGGSWPVLEPRVLLDGLAMPESPRWRNGRLWFSNWGADEIVAVDLDGNSEVVDRGPAGLGWAVNWLPDGRILMTGTELIRVEPDGSRVRHADVFGLVCGPACVLMIAQMLISFNMYSGRAQHSSATPH